MSSTKKVMCPYNGVWYHDIPGCERWLRPLKCPVCGGEQVISEDPKGKDKYPHNEIERVVLTTEEAVEIFKKYCRKELKDEYEPGKVLFRYAWEMPHWKNGDYSYARKPWMGDDLILAFYWYLDKGGWPFTKRNNKNQGFLNKVEKELNEYTRDRRHKKWDQQSKSKAKRDKKLSEQGESFTSQMKEGEVWMVKFGGHWNDRGIQVLEIEKDQISGFYLDRDDERVAGDAIEKPGYLYTKPNKYISYRNSKGEWESNGKYEWDGKTFIKTRTYETKMAKFLIRKIENPIIKK